MPAFWRGDQFPGEGEEPPFEPPEGVRPLDQTNNQAGLAAPLDLFFTHAFTPYELRTLAARVGCQLMEQNAVLRMGHGMDAEGRAEGLPDDVAATAYLIRHQTERMILESFFTAVDDQFPGPKEPDVYEDHRGHPKDPDPGKLVRGYEIYTTVFNCNGALCDVIFQDMLTFGQEMAQEEVAEQAQIIGQGAFFTLMGEVAEVYAKGVADTSKLPRAKHRRNPFVAFPFDASYSTPRGGAKQLFRGSGDVGSGEPS